MILHVLLKVVFRQYIELSVNVSLYTIFTYTVWTVNTVYCKSNSYYPGQLSRVFCFFWEWLKYNENNILIRSYLKKRETNIKKTILWKTNSAWRSLFFLFVYLTVNKNKCIEKYTNLTLIHNVICKVTSNWSYHINTVEWNYNVCLQNVVEVYSGRK